VLKCEHKYWCQLEQNRVIVGWIAESFEYVLSLADLPDEIAEIGGRVCLVEERATGSQHTIEGFSQDGRVEIYGLVDSVTYPERSSFLRYRYPSLLPRDVADRMADMSRRVIRGIGRENSTFNIEYFWDQDTETLTLLEINPRHSQSHARLFQLIDGLPNHACMIDLALGRDVTLPRGDGPYEIAAKWSPAASPTESSGERLPTPRSAPFSRTSPAPRSRSSWPRATRLSDLADQDSYSYGLANIHIGARDENELIDKYERCLAALPFEIEED
jgi:Carbamoyl-phosphate synthase L chain, ATP binding domain